MKPFTKKPFDPSKRRLLQGSVVLAGSALGTSLPVSAALSAPKVEKAVYKAPLFDPTLENYPGYSTYVPVPRSAELATAAHNLLDTQFIG
jgi:hypothetical protein